MPKLKSTLLVVGIFVCAQLVLNAQDKNPRPLMKDFIGINARASDDLTLLEQFDFVREYHEWSDDTGFDSDHIPNCPTNLLRFNPSNSLAGVINYDHFYQTLTQKVSPSMKGLAPEMIGLMQYDAVLQEQKPICKSAGSQDQNAPETYLDYTKWVSLFAMRYGNRSVCNNPALADYCHLLNNTVADGDILGAGKSGMGFLKYLEMGNEPDKWWYDDALRNTPEAVYQMMPTQYAALLHAAYDGGGSSANFRAADNSSRFLGVKNIDSSIQVVMGGLSDFRGRYLIELLNASYALRTAQSNLTKKIPFDVLNLHHYCSNVSDLGAAYIDNPSIWDTYDYFGLNTRGLSPEQCKLKERYQRFFEKLLDGVTEPAIKAELTVPTMEYWLTEFGYDSNNNSPIKAQLSSGLQSYFTTQSQWLVRAYMELSAVEYQNGTQTLVLNKVASFDLRDEAPYGEGFQWSPGGGLFTHCGLVTRNFHPKRAWYYVQTLKNVLGNTRFAKDLNASLNIQFDNGGTPPRIYYYKGENNTHILAIWSPTATKVVNRLLTLPVNTLLQQIGAPELTNISSYSIVQMADNSAVGYKKAWNVSNGQVKFNNTTVLISETPVFVVLNSNTTDPTISCPLPTPTVTSYCNGVLLEWNPVNVPKGHWNVYYAQKSNLANNATCQSYNTTDLLGNGYVQTYMTGLQADRGRLLIEGLKANTQYVVFLSFVNAAGVAARVPCVVCVSTNTSTSSIFNPCVQLTTADACDTYTSDFCKLLIENRGNASNNTCPEAQPGACIGGNPYTLPLCNVYNATGTCGQPFIYPEHQLWSACSKPEVVATFDQPVLLDAIRFYHHSGSDPIALYYSTCLNPKEKKYLLTFYPNSCNTWVSLVKNMPIEPVKKLYFQKNVPKGKAGMPDVKIGKLHFCGTFAPDCAGNTPDLMVANAQTASRDRAVTTWEMYPNPAQHTVFFQWEMEGYENLQLFDIQGRNVLALQLEPEQKQAQLEVTTLPSGVYQVRMQGGQQPPHQQLLVVRRD